ncbi:MAG: hypothetical protein JWR80_4844 [Bradyrhizobium sp.]|nr:hypothetical protein [Bradyrhizobium sp.]
MLSIKEEAAIVAFRRHTLLPLDDCLYALQVSIPHRTRSSLHRCLQRHGISELPIVEGDKPNRRKFKSYPTGYFHIDIAEVAPSRVSSTCSSRSTAPPNSPSSNCTRRPPPETQATSCGILSRRCRDKMHTVPTDNGIHFTVTGADGSAVPEIKLATANGERLWAHSLELACAQNDIDHRLTKPSHPWTNGQVERMNRTIKEATVKHYHYDTHDQLRQHLSDFVAAYNFGRRLKTLKGLTLYEAICKA